ncbi:MAG TPA: HRDC domain-containing protein [Candidatus Binatia bacterium]|nr:HRDC domain-containing protein [Candidatus Binatia bacterium]
MTDQPRLLTDPAELAALVDEIRAAGRFALDTEFVWERTYRPQLGVVQIATDRGSAILDALALPDLSSLFPLLRDPDVPVVLHGGGQDLEILAVLMGEPVRGVVDTQVVAAFLGYGLQVGLGVLLERVLRVRLRKDQTYTDWTRRPLKPEQLAYAREDVVHLLPLHDRLRAALDQRGRTAWVAEELRGLEDPAHWAPVADEERYRGVKGWQRLGGGELAVLRALAAWRERTARHVDIRPHFVANDVVLTTLAGRPVESLEELRGVRGLSPGTVSRHGRGLLAAIREGLACPPARWPARPERVRRHAPPTGLTALLRAAVQVAAEREEIAPEVIASTRDIEALVGLVTGPHEAAESEPPPLARGWRGRLIGERLLAIARGELAIRYDVRRREIVAEPVTPAGGSAR